MFIAIQFISKNGAMNTAQHSRWGGQSCRLFSAASGQEKPAWRPARRHDWLPHAPVDEEFSL
jgi:hypothetical protein